MLINIFLNFSIMLNRRITFVNEGHKMDHPRGLQRVVIGSDVGFAGKGQKC
jgi:hypothetical protein